MTPTNIPPGITDRAIEDECGTDDEEAFNAYMSTERPHRLLEAMNVGFSHLTTDEIYDLYSNLSDIRERIDADIAVWREENDTAMSHDINAAYEEMYYEGREDTI